MWASVLKFLKPFISDLFRASQRLFFVTHKYTLLISAQKRARIVTFGTFSDFNRLPNVLQTSDLLQMGQANSSDGVEGLLYGHGP